MNHLDLFSGIGGFSLGLESVGFETVAFCEIEPHLRNHLAERWPGVPVHDDIRTLTGEDIGPVDLVCGGPPCQPASRAGQQRGAQDDRWLWGEAIRLVRELRPGWVCFENPLGIYDVGIADILADLESLGYANATDRGRRYIAPVEIPACALGAFHIRNRVWILAHASREGRREATGGASCNESSDAWREEIGNHKPASDGEGAASGVLAHADSMRRTQRQELHRDDAQECSPAAGGGVLGNAQGIGRSEGRTQSEILGGRSTAAGASLPSGYEWILCHDGRLRAVEPTIPMLAHAVPDRVAKVTAFGNAVSHQVVAAIGRAILQADRICTNA